MLRRRPGPPLSQDSALTQRPPIRIRATYMRGGTSKGVFFRLQDLPEAAQVPGHVRDALLLRVIGSPDPYGKQIDGVGGASSSTSKAVILSRSSRADHDVDYLFAQVAIDRPVIDWSGNCGNLSAAVGPFAIAGNLVDAARIPRNGMAVVRIWQANIGKTIVAHVPIANGVVQETGSFALDGVAFPAAEVQDAINGDARALSMFEAIRAHGAVRMGLAQSLDEAAGRQHTPKLAFVAPPRDFTASSGRRVAAAEVDLVVRALSMGAETVLGARTGRAAGQLSPVAPVIRKANNSRD